MLATLVIGLREGLEAALIVSIIAAFLRRNGESLRPMWIGVVLAVLLSIAVGAALSLIEQSLPQAEQEALETVIGIVAVFFVTGMIAWMNSHASEMKGQLEAEAAAALGHSSVYALSGMAFLAVLKEGFETAVFLLATFSAAQSASMAAIGAVVGLVLAVIIGWGIYMGGIKINLGRFFRFTGAFLILVAAGLTISVLRTAHEAGWLNAGQQLTVSLTWLVAPGTVQSALITGVLGIPADPRLIEVIGWFAYLVPVALYIYWPQAKRPGPRQAMKLQVSIAVVLLVIAAALPFLYRAPQLHVPDVAPMEPAGKDVGSVKFVDEAGNSSPRLEIYGADAAGQTTTETIALPADARGSDLHNGLPISVWDLSDTPDAKEAPRRLTIDQVVALSGGRVPIGLNPAAYPGPYDADWTLKRSLTVRAADGALLEANAHVTALVTLSGGGLSTPRTVRVRRLPAELTAKGSWQLGSDYVDNAYSSLAGYDAALMERHLWAFQLPLVLTLAAVLLLIAALRRRIKLPQMRDASNPSTIS